MKYIQLFLLLNFFGILNAQEDFYVHLNNQETLSVFRRMDQPITDSVSLTGLDKLKFSASEQYTQTSFIQTMMGLSKNHLIVLDLRREHHGFVSGYAVSWCLSNQTIEDGPYAYNIGLSMKEIERGELKRLNSLLAAGSVTGIKSDMKEQTLLVESSYNEREIVEQAGAEYVRIPILDHNEPLNSQVDEIVVLVKNLPADSWLHLHCAGGKGRTTTVSCMIDMMHNSSKLSADEIIRRQQALGGSNLLDVAGKAKVKRREFLRLFHQYCLENPNFAKSWSEWVR